jgi:transcriptional regulator with XRE-family HTH domain
MSTTPNLPAPETRVKMTPAMPRRSRLRLPPLNLGSETVGQRLARLRKERGLTQTELADTIGIIQVLISDYEHDRLRVHADMLARFALALGVSTDEIVGLKAQKSNGHTLSRKVGRRMQQIETLPQRHQRALLQTIDAFLKSAQL